MGMIDDAIELAHTEGLVRSTTLGPDGCDGYDISASPRPITVWVRPDGRFSRATSDGELITLGQVLRGLVAATSPSTPAFSGVSTQVGAAGPPAEWWPATRRHQTG